LRAPSHDGTRRRRRRDRDPGLLRARLRLREIVPVAKGRKAGLATQATKYTPALMPTALFGITNSGLSLFVNLLILFLVVVWIALIAWTYLDAKRRVQDPVLVGCATVASLFPYVGTIVYTILRPPEYLEDAHERELEIRAAELRVKK